MSNLLKDASILLTPTAYDDGSMNSIKPENGGGDFTFSRGSAATRVNAQGLVENVQIISPELVSNGNFSQIGTEEVSNGNFSQEGSELVTNGDFSNGLTNWSVNGGSYATIVSGALNSNNPDAGNWYAENISQNISFVNGKTYKVTFKAKNISGGLNLRLTQGANVIYTTNLTSSFVDYEVYYTANADNGSIRIFCNSAVGQFQIDNISVKEVGQDWTLENGWGIGEDKAIHSGTVAGNIAQNAFTSGKSYEVKWTQTNGKFISVYGDGLSSLISNSDVNKDYTVYFNSVSGGNISFRTNVDGAEVSNISVKEVGQDWTFDEWTLHDDNGDLKAKFIGSTSGQYLKQENVYTPNSKIKLQFTLSNFTSGAFQIISTGVVWSTPTITTNGNFTYIIDTTGVNNGHIYIRANGGSFNGYVDNISVKEITDDTDLPRINYEGFSYQDALGSEEVVNGDFATDLSNWGISGNSDADHTIIWTSQGARYQSTTTSPVLFLFQNSLTSGKTYKFTVDIAYTSGAIKLQTGSGGSLFNPTLVEGTNTFYFTASSTQFLFIRSSANVDVLIDNVSVKEYLGQEVVPDSGCGSWLLEPQSTNLFAYSEDFSDSSWTKGRATITSNQEISPSGEITADKLQATTDVGAHYIRIGATRTGDFTLSIFLKKGNYNYFQIVNGQHRSWVDLELGVINNISGVNGTITNVGNDWFRVDKTYSYNSEFNYTTIGYADSSGNEISILNGNEYVYIWGAQLENQSYATSYIPTNGATNTRLQDIATNSGNSTLINSTEGVLYAEIAALADDGTNRCISLYDGSVNNRLTLVLGTTSNSIRTIIKSNGSTSFDEQHIVTSALNYNKVAVKYKANDFALWINGVEVATDTSGATPIGLDRITFDTGNGTLNLFAKAKALAVYKEALTDANLRCLTYPNPVATTFDLDFDTIAQQFTFTRGSEATFVNEQGLIESTASNDAPRIDYSTGEKAFLLEPQSTNLITYSSDFSNSSWTKVGNTVVTPNTVISPDGTLNASTVTGLSGTGSNDLRYVKSGSTANNTYTYSVYLKGSGTVRIQLSNGIDQGFDDTITLTSNWKRHFLTSTFNSTTTPNLTANLDDLNGQTATQFDIWGAQLEQQSYATSYIPTSGAAATRNQELCADATPVINSEEGTLYAEISALANDGTIRYLSLSDGTSNNRVAILYYSSSNNIRMIVSSNGTNYADKNYGVSSVLDFHKIAIKYKENDFALWVDGIEAKTDNSGNAPIGLDNLSFSIGGGGSFFGNTKGLKYYPKALADVQLEDLTTI